MPSRASHAAGDCSFAHDPDVPATQEPVLWRPELFPGTVILSAAPAGFEGATSAEPAQLGPILADHDVRGRRAIVIGDDTGGALHVWLPDAETAQPAAVILPFEPGFELRFETALRLFRRLMGLRVALLPGGLQLTSQQRTRLIQLLHAFDIHDGGGGARDVAAEVLQAGQASLPSTEWKDSAARRKALRLIKDSAELVKRGYLKILRGKFR